MGSNPTISTDIADGTAPAVPSAISAKMAPNANPVAQRLGSHSPATGAGTRSREGAEANHGAKRSYPTISTDMKRGAAGSSFHIACK